MSQFNYSWPMVFGRRRPRQSPIPYSSSTNNPPTPTPTSFPTLQGLSYSISYSSSIATLDNLSWFGLAFLALQGICHRLPPGSPIAAWVTDCVQGDRLRPGRPIASRATDCVQGDRLRPGRPIATHRAIATKKRIKVA